MDERDQYCPGETNVKGTKGEIVKTTRLPTRVRLTVLACLILISQPAGAQVPQEKQYVLDWLSEPEVAARFGAISDAIWSYAELGLQEYKSSSHSRARPRTVPATPGADAAPWMRWRS